MFKKRTLLQINVACNCGSTGKIVEQIGQKAIESGWDAHIAYSARYERPSKLTQYRVQSRFEDCIHYGFQSLVLGRAGLGSVFSTKKLLRYIDEIHPDIVHLHNLHGFYLNIKILLKYLAVQNIPVVWTLHDCWPLTGHCTYFDKVDCRKWNTQCEDCQLLSDYPRSLFFDTSREMFNLKKELISSIENLTFIPVSGWLGDIVSNSAIGKEKHVQVIRNGVNLDVFKPKGKKKDCKFRVLGVADGFGERKGLGDFLKLRELLSDDYEIAMVGVSEEDIPHLPDGINYSARTDSAEQLVAFYSNADVFINPTYSDNFPTTNIEALACGTPVITYNTGGSPEAIDEKTGVVIPKGDIYALAQAIREMRGHPLSSVDCRKRAEDYFDKEKCIQEYLKLYYELMTVHKA